VGCCLTLVRLLGMLLRPMRQRTGTPQATTEPGTPTRMLALIAGGELLLAALAVSATTPLDPSGAAHVHGGHAEASFAARLLTPSSHLLLMIQVELLTVVAPIALWLLVRPMVSRRRPAAECAECPDEGIVAELSGGRPRALTVAVLAALAYPAVIIGWHLPAVHALTHPGTADAPAVAVVRAVSLLAAGLVLWVVVLGPQPTLPGRTRALVAATALELTALPGLALLLAITPLYGATTGAFGLSALADQRIAGALMMLVDLPIALVLARRLRTADASAEPRLSMVTT
jgi:hypothetical protein